MNARIIFVSILLSCALPGCTSEPDDDGQGDGDSSGDGDGDPGPGPLDGPFDAANGPFCGDFHFVENLGPDYDTAYAAFEISIDENYDNFELLAEPFDGPVYDYYDEIVDRDFWTVLVLDANNGQILYGLNDILDSEGNLYGIDWCAD